MIDSSSILSRYGDFAGPAHIRHGHDLADTPKIKVQVGHCGLSVGASELARAVADRFGDTVPVITTGCDGACFTAPTVIVTSHSGRYHRLERVSPDDLSPIARALNDDPTLNAPNYGGDFLYGDRGEDCCLDDCCIEDCNNCRDDDCCDGDDSENCCDDYSDDTRAQHHVALQGCGFLDAESIDDYLAYDGYYGLIMAITSTPEDVIQEVKDSRIRGRGGAYFPVGLKWESARRIPSAQRYMIVNCEEGEPGLFKDRHLMEGDPHRLIEGACIAAYAANASDIIFYINAEANLAAQRMETAISQARDLGLIGKNVLGSGVDFNVEIRRGSGGYVCGEETTLINTIEGYRREPRIRPPYPVESGLWSRPTVINNAETLANIPDIINGGAEMYAEVGDGTDTGTKIINLSGAVRRPGLIEVPFGTTLRQIIYDIGGGPPEGSSIRAIGVGGPSSGILPPSMLDTPIKPGFLHESGVMLGAGAVIVMDDSMDPLTIVRNLAQYNANESCGKCTPCREGTPRMVEMIDSLADGTATQDDIEELSRLAALVNNASLCGLGQAAGNPILSALHFFRDELTAKSQP